MKHKSYITILGALFLISLLTFCTTKNEFKQQYFELPLPGETPVVFAKGIISSDDQEHSSLAFSPDGKEIYWSMWKLPHDFEKSPQVIKYIRFENGKWSKAATAQFSGKHRDGSPVFSPNGKKIFFYSRRPLEETDSTINDNDIWYVERKNTQWGKPVNAGDSINTEHVEACPSIAKNGNLYFTSNRNKYEDPTGNNDIFFAKFSNGKYLKAKSIGKNINTKNAREGFPYISPNENYLIFSRDDRHFDESGKYVYGERKLMISFRQDNEEWATPVELGEKFKNARFPSVSPDGKYLFFTKYAAHSSEDFYWVDATFIKNLNSK